MKDKILERFRREVKQVEEEASDLWYRADYYDPLPDDHLARQIFKSRRQSCYDELYVAFYLN